MLIAAAAPTTVAARPYDLKLLPAEPSARDARYVAFSDGCGETELEQPVTLRVSRNEAWLDLRKRRNDLFCYPNPPAESIVLHLLELPRDVNLPTLRVSLVDSGGYTLDREVLDASLSSAIPPSVTGTWSDPDFPAQGLIVSAAPVPIAPGHTVAWTTYDEDGEPLWLVGAAALEAELDFATEIPMHVARGGAFPGRGAGRPLVEPWGRVTLEYLGCGRMEMHWDALDAESFPPGRMQLVQLTHNSIENCDVLENARRRGQRVNLIVPTLSVAR